MTEPLLDLDIFRDRSKECRRRMDVRLFWAVGIVLGPLVVGAVVVNLMEEPESTTKPFLPVLLMTGMLPLFFWLMFRVERVADDFPDLKCIHCGAALYNHRALVISSRNCPECGRAVLHEPDATNPLNR